MAGMTAAVPPSVVLAARGLTKEFGGRTVLSDVDLTIRQGEVHALVGANGSGKSTFIKLLSGFHAPTRGTFEIAGQPLGGGPAASYAAGCRFVHQDIGGLVGTLSVADNLSLLAPYPTRWGTIRHRVLRQRVRKDLARAGARARPDDPVSSLSPATRTGVAVAGALRADPGAPARLIVFDEPTATLPADEVSQLTDTIRTVTADGLAVLYVTHRLEEVFQVADQVTILRDGERVGTWPVNELTRQTMADLITGDQLTGAQRRASARSGPGPAVLSVQEVSSPGIDGFSLDLTAGEIVGIAGVVGSGRESVLGAIFGSAPRYGGRVVLRSAVLPAGRPDRSVRAGMAYLPADRSAQGVVHGLSARENLTLSDLRPFWNGAALSRIGEIRETEAWFDDLAVSPSGATEMMLDDFSGGNQQKIVLGRLLRRRPSALLLDEPTHGVDIAAKAELHRRIAEAAASGAGVVIASSDVDELLALCDRVVIMWQGRHVGERSGDELTVANLTRQMMGIGGTG